MRKIVIPKNTKVIFALIAIHFIGDFYFSFINPLLPVFVTKFSLTLTQVGIITGASRLLAFIIQPSVGYISDHHYPRFFILGGILMSVIFIPLLGISANYGILMLFVCLGAIGSSMFHPTSAGMVSIFAGRKLGLSLSLFSMGGTLAFAVGPLFISAVVDVFGLSATAYTMVIGLVSVFFIGRILPNPQTRQLKNFGFFKSMKEAIGPVWRSLFVLWLVMVLRAYVGQSFLTFIPVLYSQEGHSLLSIGTVVSLFTIAGTISGLIAGHLSDKLGYKPIFFTAYILATPALYLLLMLSGKWVYLGSFIGGFFIFATMPLGIAIAQKLAQKSRSMASSLMMGFAYGTGGVLAPITGTLADMYSIRTVLTVLSFIPILSTLLIVLLNEPPKFADNSIY